jgi:ABC-type transport system involved in multi-copper enzyme maturation permease subunit
VLLTFLVETMLWGAAWMSITLLVSAFFARRSTAMAGSMLVWFLFAILWVPLTVILVALTGAPGVNAAARGPQWLLAIELLNPNSAYGGLVSRSIGGYPGVIGAIVQTALPLEATAFTYAVALVAWIVIPLAGAYVLFRRRDL